MQKKSFYRELAIWCEAAKDCNVPITSEQFAEGIALSFRLEGLYACRANRNATVIRYTCCLTCCESGLFNFMI